MEGTVRRPRKTAWQVKAGKPNRSGEPTWLVRCTHGTEKTNHGEAFALHLWAVSNSAAFEQDRIEARSGQ